MPTTTRKPAKTKTVDAQLGGRVASSTAYGPPVLRARALVGVRLGPSRRPDCRRDLALGNQGVHEYRIKETVFDGWLDSLVDLIDGSSDRDEDVAECIELLGDDPVCRL